MLGGVSSCVAHMSRDWGRNLLRLMSPNGLKAEGVQGLVLREAWLLGMSDVSTEGILLSTPGAWVQAVFDIPTTEEDDPAKSISLALQTLLYKVSIFII